MDFQVKLSEQAAFDLSDVIEYICDALYNPGAAEHFYNEVNKNILKIIVILIVWRYCAVK